MHRSEQRFLYWCAKARIRALHLSASAHAARRPKSDTDTRAFPEPDRYGNCYKHSNGHGDAIAYRDSNRYAESHVAAVAHTDGYSNTDTTAIVNAYTNSYLDADRYCHTEAHA